MNVPLGSRGERARAVLARCALRRTRFLFVACLVASTTLHDITRAQVATNITPSGLNTVVTPNGNVYEITGGTRPGNGPNLFHSFGEFSVGATDIARFQPTPSTLGPISLDATIGNILGRVTGVNGNPPNISSIFGTIDSATFYPKANLFLMNPAGIIFGPNASLNVGGSVTFTTANYIRLFDGVNSANFYADPAHDTLANSMFAVSPLVDFGFVTPAALGFLSDSPAGMTVQGSTLSVPLAQAITLVGGDITITTDSESGASANLLAPSGEIRIASIASAGEVLLPTLETGLNISDHSVTAFGSVRIEEGAFLDVTDNDFSGDGRGGAIRIRGGQFIMDSATLSANTLGDVDGPSLAISVDITGGITLDNFSAISAATVGAGRTGDVELRAADVQVRGGSGIGTFSLGSGHAGDVRITGSNSVTISGEFTSVTSDAFDIGNGGTISLNSNTVLIDDLAEIKTGTDTVGRAGDIILDVGNLMVLRGGSIQTLAGVSGSSGSIAITAQDTVTLSGQTSTGLNRMTDVGITSIRNLSNSDGDNGGIAINADRLVLTNDASIKSETFTGEAAPVTISANTAVTIASGSQIISEGTSSAIAPIHISAPTIMLDQGSVRTTTVGSGNAGAITLNTTIGNLILSNGSEVISSTQQGSGLGGAITLSSADSILVSGNSVVQASSGVDTVAGPRGSGDAGPITATAQDLVSLLGVGSGFFSETKASGNAGAITVRANDVQITDGAVVSAKSTGSGAAGSVTIEGTASPAQSVLIGGIGSGVFTETQSSGAGGNITVESQQVQLEDSATISSKTTGSGNAGNILVKTDTFSMTGGATITAESTGSGQAGTVTIQGLDSPAESILISGAGSGVFTTTSGTGAGGDIFLNANSVTLQNGGTLSAATSGTAASAIGGTITVHANTIEVLSGATMTAQSTGAGSAGSITVQGLASPAQSIVIDGPGSGLLTEAHGTGDGGSITVSAHQVQLTNQAKLSATTTGAGDAGDVLVQGDTVSLLSGARLESGSIKRTPTSPAPTGQGGTVTVEGIASPATSIVLSGPGSGIFTTAEGSGTGGNITMTASQSVTLTDGASVAASSTGPANAGNIAIDAGNSFFVQDSSVTTSATQASGGDISVQASSIFRMINSQMTASVQQGSNTFGGNITIDPQFVILQNQSQILATAVEGTGGNILIVTPVFLADQTSIVDASSQFGRSGTVTIQSPTSQLAGTLATLPQSVRQAAALNTVRCAAQMGGQASSFIVAGRDTLPAEPGGWMMSALTPPLSPAGRGETVESAGAGQEARRDTLTPSFSQGEREQAVSLRRMTPGGFLTQAFAIEGSPGCGS
ncbi:MAG: filamentous hemagglutinin N-terminal domain-containing protein [Nitrospirota bacterium]